VPHLGSGIYVRVVGGEGYQPGATPANRARRAARTWPGRVPCPKSARIDGTWRSLSCSRSVHATAPLPSTRIAEVPVQDMARSISGAALPSRQPHGPGLTRRGLGGRDYAGSRSGPGSTRWWCRHAAASGTQLRLAVTSEAVRRVLIRNGLDRLIPIYSSLEAAVAAAAPVAAVPVRPRPGAQHAAQAREPALRGKFRGAERPRGGQVSAGNLAGR
jgi:hypothetical protein